MLERRHHELPHVGLVERTGAGGQLVLQVKVGEPDGDELREGAVGRDLAERHMTDAACEHLLKVALGFLPRRARRRDTAT